MVWKLRGDPGQQRHLRVGTVHSSSPVTLRGHVSGLHRGMLPSQLPSSHLVTCFTCQTRANLVILNFTCLSFLQVHSTSKKLLYQLDHLVQLTNAAPNESPQKKHVSSQKHAVCKFFCKLSVGTDIYFTMYFFVI